MPSDAQLSAAALYAALMAADTHMAVSGQYERAKVWTPQLPYCANNRNLNACLWAAVHVLLLLWMIGCFSLGWSEGPEVLMAWAGVLALNRMRRVLKTTPPGDHSAEPE